MKNNKTIYKIIQDKFLKEFNDINFFTAFKNIKLKKIARESNITKKQGVEAFDILTVLLLLSFVGKTINDFMVNCRNSIFKIGEKDVFYRFSSSKNINWRTFLMNIAVKIINNLKKYKNTDDPVLIIDDTTLNKRGNKIDGLSFVYDHSKGKSVKGLTALTLGYSDGSSFIPMDISLHGSSNKIYEFNKNNKVDMRTVAGKRRKELDISRMDMVIDMLKRAYNKGIDAKYVLFDSWFCCYKTLKPIYNELGFNVISAIKNTKNLMLNYGNRPISVKKFAESILPKRNSKILDIKGTKIKVNESRALFADVEIKILSCDPIKKNKRHKKMLLICTDTELTAEEIINIYAKRWSIETMFKDEKQKLLLGKQHARKFEANICFITLSLARYAILDYISREKGDIREIGTIFENSKYDIEKLNSIDFIKRFLENIYEEIILICQDGKKMLDNMMKMLQNITNALENLIFQRCET
jgi:hypothetical protein